MVLSPQELAWLQSPPSPFHVRGKFCTVGSGLLGAYALTDVLMALSGTLLLCTIHTPNVWRILHNAHCQRSSMNTGSDLRLQCFDIWPGAGGLTLTMPATSCICVQVTICSSGTRKEAIWQMLSRTAQALASSTVWQAPSWPAALRTSSLPGGLLGWMWDPTWKLP